MQSALTVPNERSHSKKKPHCLTLGRLFNNEILDLFELVVVQDSEFVKADPVDLLKKLNDFDFAFKPVFVSIGDVFEEDSALGRLRNFFNDFFHANDE